MSFVDWLILARDTRSHCNEKHYSFPMTWISEHLHHYNNGNHNLDRYRFMCSSHSSEKCLLFSCREPNVFCNVVEWTERLSFLKRVWIWKCLNVLKFFEWMTSNCLNKVCTLCSFTQGFKRVFSQLSFLLHVLWNLSLRKTSKRFEQSVHFAPNHSRFQKGVHSIVLF